MNTIIRKTLFNTQAYLLRRSFSGTPVLETKQYRLDRGLSLHKNAEGVLTDDLCYEVDFAKERHQNMQREKENERQRIISNRLRPKGQALKKR
ncbi:Mitochondrial ribosomal protein L52 [Operophtera brumata]|uniref:Mitochondrial ribosomal protein L52 n=1 Tax=Operophtera brumata TaxID=104452 RepID=A0A0L7KX34_OPEBR|nr:Mitochondrial ribosomal protein L52 [Operophtera brumata]